MFLSLTDKLGAGYTTLRENVASKLDDVKGIANEIVETLAETDEEEDGLPSTLDETVLMPRRVSSAGDANSLTSVNEHGPTEMDLDRIREKLARHEDTAKGLSETDGMSLSKRESSLKLHPGLDVLTPCQPLEMDHSVKDQSTEEAFAPSIPPLTPRSPDEDPQLPREAVEHDEGDKSLLQIDENAPDNVLDEGCLSVVDVIDTLDDDDDDDLHNEGTETLRVALIEANTLNQELFAKTEIYHTQITSERSEVNRLSLVLEEKEELLIALKNQMAAMDNEIVDTEKQAKYWKSEALSAQVTVKELRQSHADLMSKNDRMTEQMSTTSLRENQSGNTQSLADQLKMREDELETLRTENHNLNSALEEANGQIELSAEVLEEQKHLAQQQKSSLTAQLNHYRDKDTEYQRMVEARDGLQKELAGAELNIARLKDENDELRRIKAIDDKKINDLEKGTQTLLNRITEAKVNEDQIVNVDTLRTNVEKILSQTTSNSDAELSADTKWKVLDTLANGLGLTPWERRRWLAMSETSPEMECSTSPTSRGLGAQFLSFLESDIGTAGDQSDI